MKILRKKRKNINFGDSGALSDLAFLLIVFFIVIAVFTVNQGFMLGLPQKQSTKIVRSDEIIKVKLDRNNKLIYQNQEKSLPDIENIVSNKIRDNAQMMFLLKIDKDAEYQYVINVLNIVQKLNIDRFSFSMIKEDENDN